jgi:nitrogen regulatory protein PII
MKLVSAVIQPFKLDAVRDALIGLGVHGLTVSEVTSASEALKTLRRLETTLRWTQATAPSGSQIFRHSRVSAIT